MISIVAKYSRGYISIVVTSVANAGPYFNRQCIPQ